MAEQTIKTRIKLRYDTLANWTSSNPVLAAGELGVVAIASGNTQVVNSVTAPQILFKVGDGTSTWSTLPYASGLAADVYSWAKAATKPTYTSSEVGAYSKSEVDNLISAVEGALEADTNTQYQLVQDGTTLKLQSKELNGTWVDVKSFNLYTILQDKFDAAGAAASALTNAKSYTDSELTKKANELQTAIDVESDNVDEILDGTVIVGRAKADFNNKVIHETYATKNELDAVEAKIPTIPVQSVNGKTGAVVLAAADVNTYNKTEIDAKVKANADAIEALTNGASTEEIDSVMELVAYVNEHGTEVQGIKQDIDENKQAISDLETLTQGHDTDISGILEKPAMGITSVNIADWNDAVSKEHSHNNKTVLDGITSTKVSNWDNEVGAKAAAATAQAKADSAYTLAEGKEAAGSASQALKDAKAYADSLATNYDASGAASSALEFAKAYADDEDAKIEARVTTLEGKAGLDKVGTVTSVSAGNGLKVSGTAGVAPKVEIDTNVIFVLDGGNAAGY